jgi:hypothetical protein
MYQAIVFLPLLGCIVAALISLAGARARHRAAAVHTDHQRMIMPFMRRPRIMRRMTTTRRMGTSRRPPARVRPSSSRRCSCSF